jgi:hypothetical protein
MPVDYFDIDLFQDYLQSLCERSKLVKHLKTVAPATRPQHTFARFEAQTHIAAIQNTGGPNIVVVADVFGQRVGDPDDGRIRYTVQVRFATRKAAGTRDEENAINDAIKTAESIMLKFIAMFEKDFQQGCHALESFEPEKVTWNPIDDQPWLDGYYGWDCNFSFGSYMPAHDENDWEEE